MRDIGKVSDSLVWQLGHERARAENQRVFGWGVAELRDERGNLKLEVPFTNIVTRVGNQYYADRAANIRTAPSATVTAVTNVASPVFSATAHGLGVGDVVTISGATPSSYNGSWVVTAVTANTFTVYVGTALGAGSAFNWSFKGNTLPMATGMRIGTGSTAASTTGAGSAIVTYVAAAGGAGCSLVFDVAITSALSGTDARRIQYHALWAAGDGGSANTFAEAVITVENPISDVAGTSANTITRALLSPTVAKGASDTLAITWNNDIGT